ncbi:MAG: gamma-glutamyltransferase, partial [Pseudomonadota bacterium]|nr:gamma-glutamyltransferase [Pseudomonadota bacterium]
MVTSENITEQWVVGKPAVSSRGGLVATNHYEASEIGAEVLRAGGNAADAAVAVSFAIGIVEPWNSGLGGCGFVQVFDATTRKVSSIDFGTVAPRGVNPDDYPLTGAVSDDGFGWPEVIDDRNFIGPYSVGVPTVVSGMATLLKEFGTRSWRESVEPAAWLAERGMWIDWYATMIIAHEMTIIARYPDLAEVYLPGGHPPAASYDGGMPLVSLDALATTLKRLAVAGPDDFYSGEIAAKIDSDAQRAGCALRREDLADFRTRVRDPATATYRSATIHTAPGLSAGPTLLDALRR